ncbi:MAG: tetratricopeptide repeat protein [Thermoplasmata archaeon]|nr:tetratricopeptide repeat protein [Thermoplasmata archaeon]
MEASGFADLVGRLMAAMGQHMDAVRPVPEGLLLTTGDGFLFAFLSDPSIVSLATIQSLRKEVGDQPARLVVLTPGRLPLALGAEVLREHGTLVEAARFQELVRGLGLGSYLGEEPRPDRPPPSTRLLPSAQQLDEIMRRARTWLDWGVPALALRFFRQAAGLKPEFAPARVGIGRSLLALGLTEDAERAFNEVLAIHPNEIDARLGKAAVLGARGHVRQEIEAYRTLLKEDPGRVEVRTHLLAALISQGEWAHARDEVKTMLSSAPEDPQLRFLLGVTLEKSGSARAGTEEKERARHLGLDPDRERALCEHLGLPAPVLPEPSVAPPVAIGPPPKKRAVKVSRKAARPAKRATRRGPSRPRKTK